MYYASGCWIWGGLLRVIMIFGILMPHRLGGALVLTAKPCWKPSLAVLLA